MIIGSIDGAVYAIGRPYPEAPRYLQTVPGDSNMTLTWSPPAGNSTLLYYSLYKSTEGGSFAPIADLDVGTLRYTDVGLVNGRTYGYMISATNDVGEGPFSNVAVDVPHGQETPRPSNDDDASIGPVHYLLFAAILAGTAAIIWYLRKMKE
jgi:hypothetical protein